MQDYMTSCEPKTRFIITPYSMTFISHSIETLELLLCFEKLLISSNSQVESLSYTTFTDTSVDYELFQNASTEMLFY